MARTKLKTMQSGPESHVKSRENIRPRRHSNHGNLDPSITEAESAGTTRSDSTHSDSTPMDAGNKSNDHYKSKLSPLRYTLRTWCLPIVRKETRILAELQAKTRTPALDLYFAWTANLASHSFYVLMLPPLFWFGASIMGRDLVIVLGMGIYVTGFFKDFLCLPRPRSPPLHRITMLMYTAQEYGWPSSHSANATAVTLVVLFKVLEYREELGVLKFYSLIVGLFVYYFSLIVGRLYCGMHGFFDISFGSVIGVLVFLYRHKFGDIYDKVMFFSDSRNSSLLGVLSTVAFIIFGHLFLIHIYPEPVDDCPCFDDSVAFVGVLIGLDLSHYACVLTDYFTAKNGLGDPLLIPFNSDTRWWIYLARFVLGVSVVSIWKTILKPVIFTIIPPIYKVVGVNLPRSHFISTAHTHKSTRQIRSQSLSNMKNEPMVELENVLNSVHEKDSVGPEGDIDAYELLDYQLTTDEPAVEVSISGVFKPRYDVEIVGRTIVYAGISVMAVWGLGLTAELMNVI